MGIGGTYINCNCNANRETEKGWIEDFVFNNPDSVLKIGKDEIICYANKAGNSLLKDLGTRIGEKLPVELWDKIRKAALSREPEKIELKIKEKTYIATAFASPEEYIFVSIFKFEKKENENVLKNEVNFLETLLNTIPAPVFYKDRKGIYQGCNELFAKLILDGSREEIIGRSIDDLPEKIPVKLGEIYKRMDSQLFQKGGHQVYESKVMCSDRVERYFLFNKVAYRSLNGNIKGILGVMLDITGRKNMEEKLQKSEERYRLIAEQTGQLIYDINLKNGKVEWAGAFKELTGYTYDEIKSADYYDLLEHIHPADRKRVQQAFKNCWNTGQTFDEQFRLQRKDGTYFCVENKGVYLRDEEGCVCRALGVIKDINEIKLSSKKLKESEELYRSFLQNFKGISFKLDKNFTPLFLEGALEEITGYTEADFTSGKIKLVDLIVPEDQPSHKLTRRKMKSAPDFIMENEYRLKRSDGTLRWVHELIHNVCDISGKTMFIQGYAYDITERKTAEESLAKAEEIGLKEIHHRIKNNLQIVSSLLNLQAEKFKDRDVIEAFRESENRVVSMSIIHEELYKSRNTTSIDFTSYVETLTTNLFNSYRVGNEKIQLFLDLDSFFLGIDTAIPLGIIINELFSNSLKYAFPKGKEGKIKIVLHRNPEPEALEKSSLSANILDSKDIQEAYPEYTLIYSDTGGYFPENVDFKNPETLGLQLINALVDQLDGTVILEKGKETKFIIKFNNKLIPEQN